MTKAELITKIEALNEWEELMEQAKAEAEAIRDSIKEEMLEREGVRAWNQRVYRVLKLLKEYLEKESLET